MKYWRSMIIGMHEYRWRYFYDDLDFFNYPFSYLLICPSSNRTNEIRILFNKLAPPMLLQGDKGQPAVKNGTKLFINLNEPKYIKEITTYLLNEGIDFKEHDKWAFDNGEDILRKLGYVFEA